MAKFSRDKGKRFERQIAKDMRCLYGDGVKRGWQARQGQDAPDVDGTPWWIECKHHAKVNWRQAFYQASEARIMAEDERPQVAICKDTHGLTVAIMLYDDFATLLRGEKNGRNL